jgi:amino acid adenylation domain-containing protein/non-ribosomal peptide synthase protein (TIGR01720 family)
MDRSGPPPLQPAPRQGPLPLSFSQERLWFLDRLHPGAAIYNVPSLYRLRGRLDEKALRWTLDELVRRHEALRTIFPEIDGRPVQMVEPPRPFPLATLDLRALARAETREAEVGVLVRAEIGRPFDLSRGPVARGLLLRLGRGEHLFLLMLHHIIADGLSVGVLNRELGTLYAAFLYREPSPLSDLTLQPADVACWQRERLQGETLDRLLRFWTAKLGGSLPLLELPTDHPRPAVLRFLGGRERVPFGSSEGIRGLPATLRDFALREQATPFMVLFAAFLALLHRHTGQTDLLVGFPSAGRLRKDFEKLVGFFANTLVLRTVLPTETAGDPTFRDLLRKVRLGLVEALAHQEIPFERLVDELQPERALSHTPLVQVVFQMQKAPPSRLDLPDLVLLPEPTETTTSKFDLTFLVEEGSEGLRGLIEYNRDLFEAPTMRRLGEHFRQLLEGALSRPETPLSALPLMTSGERHQLLVEWNDTRAADPGALVHDLFAEQARRTPDAPALISGNEVTTYAELADRAASLASHLRSLGVGPEVRVGVSLERSPELIVSLLAILQAGGVYVPVDPSWPEERRLGLLEEAGVGVVIEGEEIALLRVGAGLGARGSGNPPWEESIGEDRAGYPPDHTPKPAPTRSHLGEGLAATPDNLAYVIYTSGSTGQPKGVAVTHRAIVRLVRDAGYADLGPDQVFLQLAPVSFDASTFEIWACLLHGGQLVIFPPEVPSLADLGAAVRENGVTTLWLTAGLFHAMVEERLADLAGVRQLLAGGDVLSPVHVQRVLEALPDTRLVNGYGPTECTTFACCHSMTAMTGSGPPGPVPIGRPIGNTRAYVVDRQLRPTPIGVPGELLLGGDGLARGYLEDPALTASRFVPDPFAEKGERLYRTGDLVRWRPDGRLELLGRMDMQVKIRGFRVEPGEIEAALAAHPAVGEAAVVVDGRGADGKRLVAFVAVAAEEKAELRELRSWLQERLPPWMIPAVVLTVSDLPLTPNGKVDRRVLEALAAEAHPEATGEAAPPRTDLERRLAEVWAEVLRLDRVGIHDNFFALGGDSLLAIQIASRAGRAGVPLTLRQLFAHQTVAELAEAIASARTVEADQGWVAGPVPMTPGQVWFFDRIASHLDAPHRFSTLALLESRTPIPVAGMVRAVLRTLFQHDALRLRFTQRDGRWEQHNGGPEALEGAWAHVDLAAIHLDAHDGVMADAAEAILAQTDLEGPLSRFLLFDRGSEHPARLLITLHHLVSDAASWRILRETLETALEQEARGEEIRLPPKTTSFRAWAQRQEELARSRELRDQVDFWLHVAQVGAHHLPADDPAGSAGTGAIDRVSVLLEEAESNVLLHDLPSKRGLRFTDVVLAAVARAFAAWTGSGTLLIRQTSHGRDPVFDDVDLSRTLGWISTTAPVLFELAGTETPDEALATVKEQLERVPLQGLGYGVLRYMTGDPDIEARMATVVAGPAATFNFVGRFDGEPEGTALLVDVRLGERRPKRPVPRRDPQLRISGAVIGQPARLGLSWEYGRDFYRRETIEWVAERCLVELRGLLG